MGKYRTNSDFQNRADYALSFFAGSVKFAKKDQDALSGLRGWSRDPGRTIWGRREKHSELRN
jgi:hypothetical protein